MREPQMREVADLIARVSVKGEVPERIAKDVASVRGQFNRVQFCFSTESEAHRRWKLS